MNEIQEIVSLITLLSRAMIPMDYYAIDMPKSRNYFLDYYLAITIFSHANLIDY